jgi:hypothetical protein
MKIREVVTEAEKLASPVRLVTLLQQNCKPFLSQAGWDHPMYRGVTRELPAVSLQQNIANRRPVNTVASLSNLADSWFVEHTGIKFRSNAVFAAGDLATARSYGTVYVMFPIGEFKFCWSPVVEDMFMMINDLNNRVPRNTMEVPELFKAEMLKRMGHAGYRTDHLIEAIDSTSEIMVHCNKYYLLSEDMFKAVLTLVKKPGLT